MAGCGQTGHLAEETYTPGSVVTGRGGRDVSQLPTAVQQALPRDMADCQQQAAVTVPNDRMALMALAGAASGVLAAHGGAARVQGGLNGANNGIAQTDSALTQDVRQAADWRASDCLKQRGWDSMPRFMVR
ncbi:MAG: hypothetical protein JOY70_03610 [Acidisphaera sp.]|nr:hypothetical protein [Acidisphaera sp.]